MNKKFLALFLLSPALTKSALPAINDPLSIDLLEGNDSSDESMDSFTDDSDNMSDTEIPDCWEDPDDWTELLCAAARNNIEQMSTILESGNVDINTQDGDGWTALHHAVVGGSEEMLDLLLQNGADHTLPNFKGETPEILARSIGNNNFADVLANT